MLLIANDGPLPAEWRDHELTGGEISKVLLQVRRRRLKSRVPGGSASV
jgi:mRNA-degrading endonuclease YafQ of YafQ-DinJ toxin-antitoxin module